MTSYYNEIGPKAAAWLRELIKAGRIAPGEVDDRDIRDIRAADLHGFAQCHFFAGIGVWSYALRRAGWPDDRPVWTGSCPCQPFSAAGKGGGFDDERHLWPAWFWLIEQCRPPIVFGEQVASKDAEPWIDLVQDDLEAVGYGVGAVPFPAAGIGAPHIRDRLYWVADAAGRGQREFRCSLEPGQVRHADRGDIVGRLADTIGERRRLGQSGGEDASHAAIAIEAGGLALADGGHPGAERQQRGGEQRQQPQDGGASGVAEPNSQRRDGQSTHVRSNESGWIEADHLEASGRGEIGGRPGPTNGLWRDADWLLCRDGKWRPVEPGTFPLVASVAKGMGRGSDPSAPIDPVSAEARVMRLRGYGNAINAEAAVAFIGSYLGTGEAA